LVVHTGSVLFRWLVAPRPVKTVAAILVRRDLFDIAIDAVQAIPILVVHPEVVGGCQDPAMEVYILAAPAPTSAVPIIDLAIRVPIGFTEALHFGCAPRPGKR